MTAPTDTEPSTSLRPLLPAAGLWLATAGILVALDGPVGAAVAVGIAAVVLAGLPRSVLALVGVVLLASVPIAVLVNGLPADDEVSPQFVVGSLWPHHLTLAGLVLLGSYVVLDVAAQRRAEVAAGRGPTPDGDDLPGPVPRPVAWALLAIVAIGAVAASLAVLAA